MKRISEKLQEKGSADIDGLQVITPIKQPTSSGNIRKELEPVPPHMSRHLIGVEKNTALIVRGHGSICQLENHPHDAYNNFISRRIPRHGAEFIERRLGHLVVQQPIRLCSNVISANGPSNAWRTSPRHVALPSIREDVAIVDSMED